MLDGGWCGEFDDFAIFIGDGAVFVVLVVLYFHFVFWLMLMRKNWQTKSPRAVMLLGPSGSGGGVDVENKKPEGCVAPRAVRRGWCVVGLCVKGFLECFDSCRGLVVKLNSRYGLNGDLRSGHFVTELFGKFGFQFVGFFSGGDPVAPELDFVGRCFVALFFAVVLDQAALDKIGEAVASGWCVAEVYDFVGGGIQDLHFRILFSV